MFAGLTDAIYEDFLRFLLRAPIVVRAAEEPEEDELASRKVSYSNPEENLSRTGVGDAVEESESAAKEQPKKTAPITKDPNDPYANVGRNDPCPCGSGKKFKKCHGAPRS